VSESDREATIMRRPWPTGDSSTMGGGKENFLAITILIGFRTLSTWLNWAVRWDRYAVPKRQ
jgi:hypothetical protein